MLLHPGGLTLERGLRLGSEVIFVEAEEDWTRSSWEPGTAVPATALVPPVVDEPPAVLA
jgi:hypothetical protein